MLPSRLASTARLCRASAASCTTQSRWKYCLPKMSWSATSASWLLGWPHGAVSLPIRLSLLGKKDKEFQAELRVWPGQSEPDCDLGATRVYLGHEHHLGRSLTIVVLIDAEGIDPQSPRPGLVAGMVQGIRKIRKEPGELQTSKVDCALAVVMRRGP